MRDVRRGERAHDENRDVVMLMAPSHTKCAVVVIDVLSPAQMGQIDDITATVLERLDPHMDIGSR